MQTIHLKKPTSDIEVIIADTKHVFNKNGRLYKPAIRKGILTGADIGEHIEGKKKYKGIYGGTHKLPPNVDDREYDLFFGPEDLTVNYKNVTKIGGKELKATFDGVQKQVHDLKNWHGHNGSVIEYNGGNFSHPFDLSHFKDWFIPTLAMLAGIDDHDSKIRCNNLFAMRDQMPAGSELVTTKSSFYFSCEVSLPPYQHVETANFGGKKPYSHSVRVDESFSAHTRLVRMEPRVS